MSNINYIFNVSKKHKILQQQIKKTRLSMMMHYQTVSLKKETLRVKGRLMSL